MSDKNTLKPCPFCGGAAEIEYSKGYTTFKHNGTLDCFLFDSEESYEGDCAEKWTEDWNWRYAG